MSKELPPRSKSDILTPVANGDMMFFEEQKMHVKLATLEVLIDIRDALIDIATKPS